MGSGGLMPKHAGFASVLFLAVILLGSLNALGPVPGANRSPEPPGDPVASGSPESPTPLTAEDRYRQLVDYSDVVVLRNPNSPDSMDIAADFIAVRGVPANNVCDIATSTAETISRATFDVLRADVEACLTSKGLILSTNYLVTTKGFPLRVSDVTDKNAAVDSELALILGPYATFINQTWWRDNPYFTAGGPFSRATYGFYIVTRLTAFSSSGAKSLTDLATAGIGRKGRFVFDVDPTKGGGYTIGNTWMIDAAAILQGRGFDVLLDQTNPFVTGESDVAGYTSWGSNDATWYLNALANPSFETDADANGIPDGWTVVNETGVTVTRDSLTADSGTWSVRISKPAPTANATFVYQDVTPLADTRYYATGQVNYSGVTAPGGVQLQLLALDANGTVLGWTSTPFLTGTSPWRSLGQLLYDPVPGAVTLRLAALLFAAPGTVWFDTLRLTPIRPHMDWLPGALAETYVSTGGRSFTLGTGYGQSLVADLLLDGVTGLKGYVYEPYLNAVAHPDILFPRLTDGRTLGESFASASELLLSWMDVIVGDPKFAPYRLSYVPDLAVEPSNVTVSPTVSASGVVLNVTAVVENRGNYPVETASVAVTLGDPAAGGRWLANLTMSLDHASAAPLALDWDTWGYVGTLPLCVRADVLDEYFEVSEANNVACVPLTVDPPIALALSLGPNLVSLPLIQPRDDVPWVLRSIAGAYDHVRAYDAGDAVDPWKDHILGKAARPLSTLDHRIGFWINVTAPGGATLLVGGLYPTATAIDLRPGWNLVGFPSGTDRDVGSAFVGVPVARVEVFGSAPDPYGLRALGPTDLLRPGFGVWVYARSASVWVVPY